MGWNWSSNWGSSYNYHSSYYYSNNHGYSGYYYNYRSNQWYDDIDDYYYWYLLYTDSYTWGSSQVLYDFNLVCESCNNHYELNDEGYCEIDHNNDCADNEFFDYCYQTCRRCKDGCNKCRINNWYKYECVECEEGLELSENKK